MESYTIGFDLGGTKMLSAVFGQNWKCVNRVKQKSNAWKGPGTIVDAIIAAIKQNLSELQIETIAVKSIGIAVPGWVDHKNGTVIRCPNLGLENYPLANKLRKIFQVPILLENDVNAGTYGEYCLGSAKGYNNVAGIFPGTGIGGGLILNGQLYRGKNGGAGEIGHMIIQAGGPLCNCGQYGCVEALSSKLAMSKDAIALVSTGNTCASLKNYGTDFNNYTSKFFLQAVQAKDKKIIRVLHRAAFYLGIAMANVVNLLNPEIIVLGGGLIQKLKGYYLKQAEASMRQHAIKSLAEDIKVVTAQLQDDSVAAGAAILSLEALGIQRGEQ